MRELISILSGKTPSLSLFIRLSLRPKVFMDFLKHMFILHMMLELVCRRKGRWFSEEFGVTSVPFF